MTKLRSRLKNLAKRQLGDLQNYAQKLRPGSDGQDTSIARCLQWLQRNELPSGGIRAHSRHLGAYPEVTGYLIPTLLDFGEQDLARRFLRWLLCVQRADGGFTSPEGEPHIFDTGQALRGLIAGIPLESGAHQAAERCADYLCQQTVEGGAKGFGPRYDGSIPESVHLYVLPPLAQAAALFGNAKYRDTVQRCLDFYIRHEEALKPGTLTHFLAYELEALIDLGRADAAASMLGQLEEKQLADGSVRAFEGVKWVCTPGLAQLAICWFKLGNHEPAEKAVAWLEKHQRTTGGFFGSYGPAANYFPREEIPWAAKFYLDAHKLRVRSFIENNLEIFPADVAADDGRLLAVSKVVRPGDKVAEIGCGKGRFLKALTRLHANLEATGVDISPKMLAMVPSSITRLEGSLENLPCDNSSFDVVFSIEAVEHSSNLERAIAEMVRATKPGGWIVVIDKQSRHWGRFECPPWERWPEDETLKGLLRRECDSVQSYPVSYDAHPADGLMLAWVGQKRSRLSGSAWNKALIGTETSETVVREVREGRLTEWAREVILHTAPGRSVLEIGSGTGQISLQLAQAGRKVTVNDISKESLDFTKHCAGLLKLEIEALEADATQKLSLPDNAFECTWNSGLLEHFTQSERRAMLREWARVTSGQLIILVPNASSLAYRAGKLSQESDGTWPYGLEVPLVSLREDFAAAGLTVLEEYSIGAQHSLEFLPRKHPLRRPLARWMNEVPRKFLGSCNQGYLLVTIGTKSPVK
jgi:malonyl-CoA O-methyltransferase